MLREAEVLTETADRLYAEAQVLLKRVFAAGEAAGIGARNTTGNTDIQPLTP